MEDSINPLNITDPWDFLCRLQEEQAQLRNENTKLMRNQRELAAAYNKLKDDHDKILINLKDLIKINRELRKETWKL